MKIEQHEKNVHVLKLSGNKCRIACLSDLHWDNNKCDRKLLKQHLDYCKKLSIPIFLNGDTWCLMEGRFDFRGSKKSLRPEFKVDNYFDEIINQSVEWFKPYAHLIVLIGYGNHETNITKRHETDIIKRFVKLMNAETGSNIQVGGYGGWLIVELTHQGAKQTYRLKYHHGLSKGASVVTKGAIDLSRALMMFDTMDVYMQGHIHQSMSRNDIKETVMHDKSGYRSKPQHIHHMITGCYKEEYFNTGGMGWHVMRGAEPRTLGGRLLTLSFKRETKDGVRKNVKFVDSCRFPM